jgi:sulfopyruvate decarboxylase TPP-binding subunit
MSVQTTTRAGEPAAAEEQVLSGPKIIAAIKAAGVEFVLSVPDITTSEGLLRPIAHDRAFRLVRVCKEDECIAIAAGLAYCGKRALVLIQHTGLLDSINALRGVAVEFAQPVCLMVGLLEREPTVPPRQSARYGVRIVQPILDAMGITHDLIDTDADVHRIAPAIAESYRASKPSALLIGRRPRP